VAKSFSKQAFVGDSIVLRLTITRNGAAVDLTGATLWFTAKEDWDDLDADAVFQKKTGGLGIAVTDALAGEATVTIPGSDTASLDNEVQTLECDVQLLEVDGTLTTVARGQLVLQPQITRATS
jgi:hypothetical protein